jgi:hypothetical protein
MNFVSPVHLFRDPFQLCAGNKDTRIQNACLQHADQNQQDAKKTIAVVGAVGAVAVLLYFWLR